MNRAVAAPTACLWDQMHGSQRHNPASLTDSMKRNWKLCCTSGMWSPLLVLAALGLTLGCLRQVKGQYPFQHLRLLWRVKSRALHLPHFFCTCNDDTARVVVS